MPIDFNPMQNQFIQGQQPFYGASIASPIAMGGYLPQQIPQRYIQPGLQSPVTHLGVSYSQPIDIPLPAHRQVVRKAVDRQVLIPQQPDIKVVN